mmetsp:Transcript_28050/g.97029  ORF Transcript_28050/g.97029 Transcript_28050/m.97029 type:complete len:700 (-) Transcript_28050:450-2549(-)
MATEAASANPRVEAGAGASSADPAAPAAPATADADTNGDTTSVSVESADSKRRTSLRQRAVSGAAKMRNTREAIVFHVKGGVVSIGSDLASGARLAIQRTQRNLGRATWKRPKLVVDWHRRDVHLNPPTWLELFYDLILVAGCLNMGNYLKSDLSWLGFVNFVGQALLFWVVWLQQVLYISRFHAHDTAHRAFELGNCVGLIGMAVAIPSNAAQYPDHINFFIGCFLLVNAVGTFQMFEVYKTSQRARYSAFWQVCGNLGFMLPVVVSMFVPFDWKAPMWLLGVPIQRLVSLPFYRAPEAKRIPVHVEHFSERHGELAMLALGEGVISLSLPAFVPGFDHPFFVALGVLTIMLLQTLYFEAQPNKADDHGLRQSLRTSTYFLYGHLALFMSLVATGVGLKILLAHIETELHAPEAWLLCGGFTVSLLALHIIRASHKPGFTNTLGGKTMAEATTTGWWLARTVLALLPLTVPIGVHAHALGPLAVIALLATDGVLTMLLEHYGRDMMIEETEFVEDDRYTDSAIVSAIVEQAAQAGGRGLTAEEVEYLKAQYMKELGVASNATSAGDLDIVVEVEDGDDAEASGAEATADAGVTEPPAAAAAAPEAEAGAGGGDAATKEVPAPAQLPAAAKDACVTSIRPELREAVCAEAKKHRAAFVPREGEDEAMTRLRMQVHCLERTLEAVLLGRGKVPTTSHVDA